MSYWNRETVSIDVLVGLTLESVTGNVGGDEILFRATDGQEFKLYHEQDCCESVQVDDIVGDLSDLVGSPITVAREDTNADAPAKSEYGYTDESFTWTFYNLATVKGAVTIKWYGSSNGYYSEGVDFMRVPK